jgi:hypothetical protein
MEPKSEILGTGDLENKNLKQRKRSQKQKQLRSSYVLYVFKLLKNFRSLIEVGMGHKHGNL